MFHCPHCGKAIDDESSDNIPSCNYDPSRVKASLGCGTFVLIAIIVAIFTSAGDDSKSLRDLQGEIQKLVQKIDQQAQVAASQVTDQERVHRLSIEPLSGEGKRLTTQAAEPGGEGGVPALETNNQKVETLTGTITDSTLSAAQDAVAFVVELDKQNTVIVLVPPVVYAALTSSRTLRSLQGKTVHATGKTEPYTGRNEAWKKMQQLTIENANALQILK